MKNSAREIALKILCRTEKDGSFPNLLLSNDLKSLQNVQLEKMINLKI